MKKKASGNDFYCSFVYAHNAPNDRIELWNDIKEAVIDMLNKFRVVLRDFNMIWNNMERSGVAPIGMSKGNLVFWLCVINYV